MFITLEGIEGSGKTTEIKFLRRYLENKGIGCVFTREPGGTEIGSQVRKTLLAPENTALEPYAELLLYIADRVQHVNEVIIPALDAGKWVVCDRYFDATLVYQGYARGLDMDVMYALHHKMCRNLYPDLTMLFDLEPARGLQRALGDLSSGTRGNEESRFEMETLDFHTKIRNGYLDLAEHDPDRFRVIDASGTPEQVHELFMVELEDYLNIYEVR